MKNAEKTRVLIVDDDPTIAVLATRFLEKSGHQVDAVRSLADMHAHIATTRIDYVFLDIHLGADDGFAGLRSIVRSHPGICVFMLTADVTIDHAVRAIREGAAGFVTKPFELRTLTEALASVPRTSRPDDDLNLIGCSPAMNLVRENIRRFSVVDSTVLVTGESGTGKEIVARALHSGSSRSAAAFHAVNCGAIPRDLLEAELFGHRKGAYTDAKNDRIGHFELCTDGTLLLDEIGEMPIELQAKILRAIQEREITPLGSSSARKINTRIIAATNRDLRSLAGEGKFREDLYFRIAVLKIHIPPLRERTEDIPLLLRHFIEIYNERFNRNVQVPSRDCLVRLCAYSWPGNVRELQNAVERGVLLAHGEMMTFDDMLGDHVPRPEEEPPLFECELNPLTEARMMFERRYLERLMSMTSGNVSEAARRAGRYRADIHKLLSKHGLVSAEFRRRAQASGIGR